MHRSSTPLLILFIVLGLMPHRGISQRHQTQLDSLLGVLKKTGNNPTEDVVTLRNKIGRLYKQRNLKQALQFAEETLPIAERANAPSTLTNSYALAADLANLTGDFTKGALYADKAAKSIQDQPDSLSQAKKFIVLMNKGGWISPLVSPDEKIKYGLKSLEIYTRLKNEGGIATACTELGTAYKNKALHRSKDIASDDSLDFEKARQYFHRAADYNRKVKNIPQLAYCITIEAMMERQLGFLEKAYRLNQTAIRLYDQEECLLGAALPFSEISDIYFTKKNFDSAQWYIRRSIDLYEQVGYKGNIEEFYDRLSKIYEATHNYKYALENMKKAKDAREKKYASETTRQIMEIETKFENKLKEEQIHTLSAEKLLHEEQAALDKTIFWGVVSFFILVTSGVIVYLRQRQKTIIQRQSAASHQEKERISQDLHDNIGSQLATVTLGLNKLIKEHKLEPSQVGHLHETLSSTIVELRDTIWAINKEEVSLEELADKIKNLFWRMGKSDSEIKYDLEIQREYIHEKLKPSQAVNTFRIIQESIHNSVKHGEASEVKVSIEFHPNDGVCVSIFDNGTGFDPDTIRSTGHYGLGNIKKRAQEILGKAEIVSAPGEGTTILLSFPIKGQNLKERITADEKKSVSMA